MTKVIASNIPQIKEGKRVYFTQTLFGGKIKKIKVAKTIGCYTVPAWEIKEVSAAHMGSETEKETSPISCAVIGGALGGGWGALAGLVASDYLGTEKTTDYYCYIFTMRNGSKWAIMTIDEKVKDMIWNTATHFKISESYDG